MTTEKLLQLLEKEKEFRQKIENYKERFEQAVNKQRKSVLSKRLMKLQEKLANLIYTIAVEKYGVIKNLFLGYLRFIRCNRWKTKLHKLQKGCSDNDY